MVQKANLDDSHHSPPSGKRKKRTFMHVGMVAGMSIESPQQHYSLVLIIQYNLSCILFSKKLIQGQLAEVRTSTSRATSSSSSGRIPGCSLASRARESFLGRPRNLIWMGCAPNTGPGRPLGVILIKCPSHFICLTKAVSGPTRSRFLSNLVNSLKWGQGSNRFVPHCVCVGSYCSPITNPLPMSPDRENPQMNLRTI